MNPLETVLIAAAAILAVRILAELILNYIDRKENR